MPTLSIDEMRKARSLAAAKKVWDLIAELDSTGTTQLKIAALLFAAACHLYRNNIPDLERRKKFMRWLIETQIIDSGPADITSTPAPPDLPH